jgi:hypothetical protein
MRGLAEIVACHIVDWRDWRLDGRPNRPWNRLSLIGDIIAGITGTVVASLLFPRLGLRLGNGIVVEIIAAAICALCCS